MAEKLEFKISTGLKNIIGKELITNDLIAIFELVKNSYDANAKTVKIVFQNIKNENKKKGSKILIIDDGDGMSYDEIKNKWLFVGFSSKKFSEAELENTDEDYRDKIQKRVFAGAKGVGRFSCDRLGKKLNLYTRKKDNDPIQCLSMDWSRFEEDQKKQFETVKVAYSNVNRINIGGYNINDFKNGTILEISELNDSWDWDKLLKLKRHLQRLINPSQISDIPEFQIILGAEEFLDEDKNKENSEFDIINGVVRNILFEKLDIKTTQITCKIDRYGNNINTKLTHKGEEIFTLEETNNEKLLRNINVTVFYLNTEAKRTFTKLMGLEPVRYGSIFLYKNGFRIFPNGDEGDDWLQLDKRKTQGYHRFFGNRELMGRVEIYGNQPEFREVSSRDGGIIKTESYNKLIEFIISKALRRLEKYVIDALDWDNEEGIRTPEEIRSGSLKLLNDIIGQATNPKVSFNENLLKIENERQIEKLPEILKNIETIKNVVSSPEEKKYIEKQVQAVRKTFQGAKKEVENLRMDVKQVEKENLFLKAITSKDKDDIIPLQHQIGLATSTINNHLKYLKQKVEKGKLVSNEDIINTVDKISLETQKIATIVKFVTKANFDLMTENVEIDLVSFVKQYIENVYKHYKEIEIDNKNVNIKVTLEKEFVFIYNFKPLEVIIIIDNIISNSIKAGATNIDVAIKKINANEVELTFKDDGKGIPSNDIDKIFNFGFSKFGGSGIGLHHVNTIVKKLNGTIDVNHDLKKGAEFVVRVRK